jgi:arabinose-5-phosphate isomerase
MVKTMFIEKKLSQIMLTPDEFPVLNASSSLKNALDQMTKFGIGISCFVNEGKLVGILTDGDLRRLILTKQNPLPALLVEDAINFGTKNPISIKNEENYENAKTLMDNKKIWDIPVVDANNTLIGLINRHKLG